jgi:hypothetical protein
MEQRPPAGGPEAPATNLVITFRNAGVAEVREASRIAIDGSGRLILYQGTRPGECLVLSRIRELRISPVRQHGEGGRLPPRRHPDCVAPGHVGLLN